MVGGVVLGAAHLRAVDAHVAGRVAVGVHGTLRVKVDAEGRLHLPTAFGLTRWPPDEVDGPEQREYHAGAPAMRRWPK